MKTITASQAEARQKAAEKLLCAIEAKADAVLAISAGEDELAVLRAAVSLADERGVRLDRLRVFSACEFAGLDGSDSRSLSARLRRLLPAAELLVPDAADCAAYDRAVEAFGGLDLALLGLGVNARVAFNEPATPYASLTHVQKLTRKTREEFSPLFGSEESVPPYGVTLGFGNLCAAREIVVAAFGAKKSRAVFHMLYARDDSVYPAAFLQLPPNVTLCADEAASADL